MCNKINKTIIILVLIFSLNSAQAQKFNYNVDFYVMFDNMESPTNTAKSGTRFPVALAPTFGVEFEGKHSLILGADLMQFMGDSTWLTKADLTLYYKYDNDAFRVNAGSIPRKELINKYPYSFFETNFQYYKPNIKGLTFAHRSNAGNVELFCDWYGSGSKVMFDEFMIVGSAEYGLFKKMWLLGANVLLNHFSHAECLVDSYLIERLQYNLYTGVDFKPLLPFMDALRISGGVMGNIERRRVIDASASWHSHPGWQVDFEIGYKGFAIENNTFWGEPQHEYQGKYVDRLYSGSPFYNSSFYDRLEAGYTYNYKFLSVMGGLILHFYDSNVANQQVIRLSFNFGGTFGKKNKKKA